MCYDYPSTLTEKTMLIVIKAIAAALLVLLALLAVFIFMTNTEY